MSAQGWAVDTALVMAVVGLVLGAFVPQVLARIPEPAEESPDETAGEDCGEVPGEAREESPPEEPKERYDAIAALPGLRRKTALATGLVSGLLGARVGWGPELPFLGYLAPIGVALAVVDWRTRLLPTRVIAPSYAVVAVLVVAAAALSGDWDSLLRAAWGWLTAGGTFLVLWFVYPRGMGYGDVRLAGVLGIALGYLGWAELLSGVYAGFLIGGVGGLLLSLLRIVDRKAYPFGPFMLVGALVGVLIGPGVAAWYA